jgi:hypothetical protein
MRLRGVQCEMGGRRMLTANDPDSRINKSLRAWNC